MSATAIFHIGGRQLVAQLLNGSASAPASIYVGLRTLDGASGHPSDAAIADTLTSNLAEASGAGYTPAASPGRITVTNNNTNIPASLNGSNWQLAMVAQTFNFNSATGSPLNGVTHCFWATTANNSGLLIASMPLGVVRNYVGAASNGDSEVVTPTLISSGL